MQYIQNTIDDLCHDKYLQSDGIYITPDSKKTHDNHFRCQFVTSMSLNKVWLNNKVRTYEEIKINLSLTKDMIADYYSSIQNTTRKNILSKLNTVEERFLKNELGWRTSIKNIYGNKHCLVPPNHLFFPNYKEMLQIQGQELLKKFQPQDPSKFDFDDSKSNLSQSSSDDSDSSESVSSPIFDSKFNNLPEPLELPSPKHFSKNNIEKASPIFHSNLDDLSEPLELPSPIYSSNNNIENVNFSPARSRSYENNYSSFSDREEDSFDFPLLPPILPSSLS